MARDGNKQRVVFLKNNIVAKDAFDIEDFRHFSIVVTDNCNLHCPCCSTRSNLPIRDDSQYLCRQWEYKIPLKDLETFCKKLDGIGHTDWHRLTGGEPTLYPDLVRGCIDILRDNNREVCLFTNGHRLIELEPEYLNEVGWIELDDHGTNHNTVKEAVRYLKPWYKGKLHLIRYNTHYDLEYAMYHPTNDIYCGHMCRVVMLFNHIIYPCAHFYCTELFQNTTRFSDLLRDTGWTVDNDFVSLLRNWSTSIHGDLWDMCYSCWRPYYKMRKLPKMRQK